MRLTIRAKRDRSEPAYAPFGIGSYTLSGGCSYYFGSLRARLGYALGDALIYATAGVAYGGNRRPGSVALNPPAFGNYFVAGESHSARTKYVFGAGIEYALSDHWFARAEYQYVNLGRIDQFFANGLTGLFLKPVQPEPRLPGWPRLQVRDGAPANEAPPAASSEAKAPKADAEQYSAHGMVTWVADGIHISLDYQFVDNPGYNLVRGPVSLFALRLHAEF